MPSNPFDYKCISEIYLAGRKTMSMKFTAVITKEENWYVSHCVELGVVSQGKTIEEAQLNLKEAVELYIESFGTEDIPESKGEVVFYPLEVVIGG
jgi:predicted RNase H-like HicB family nuclease